MTTTIKSANLLQHALGALGRRQGKSDNGLGPSHVAKANRTSRVDVDRYSETSGVGQDWAKTVYGSYYASSVPVYSAIRVRSEALARPGVTALARDGSSGWIPVSPDHPVQQLIDRVNPWHTRGDLWRATETYLSLWGSAFWALEPDDEGRWEIWPLRPDRMRVLPDRHRYVKGYVYMGVTGPVPYTRDEVVWFRYFNPMDEYAGLSPMAPLRFNRNFFRNSAQPDVIFTTEEGMTDDEVEDFYQRWERRFRGPGNAHRPAIASFIKDIKTLGFTHREMEFVQGLRWSLEDVSRTFGVPMPLLSDYQNATLARTSTQRNVIFWRNTMIPEMKFLEEHINEKLLPMLGHSGVRVEFDLADIEALKEDENDRANREALLLDRGVLTINEVRRSRNLPDVPWGDAPRAV